MYKYILVLLIVSSTQAGLLTKVIEGGVDAATNGLKHKSYVPVKEASKDSTPVSSEELNGTYTHEVTHSKPFKVCEPVKGKVTARSIRACKVRLMERLTSVQPIAIAYKHNAINNTHLAEVIIRIEQTKERVKQLKQHVLKCGFLAAVKIEDICVWAMSGEKAINRSVFMSTSDAFNDKDQAEAKIKIGVYRHFYKKYGFVLDHLMATEGNYKTIFDTTIDNYNKNHRVISNYLNSRDTLAGLYKREDGLNGVGLYKHLLTYSDYKEFHNGTSYYTSGFVSIVKYLIGHDVTAISRGSYEHCISEGKGELLARRISEVNKSIELVRIVSKDYPNLFTADVIDSAYVGDLETLITSRAAMIKIQKSRAAQ
jgi:hypothetical protein